ncbi:hypothetical protein BGZ65_003044 [Modicella reniformis]|uniref:Uncharacterized protein n=1 Tax=Modicella reniformis TaxID=1440133 RepID=A0A9P6J071_9FUNG|nr:hypothetical protein BGZ65_003044 [Modicella reniformis]
MLNEKPPKALENLRTRFSLGDSLQVTKRFAVLVVLLANSEGDLEVILTVHSSTLRNDSGFSAFSGAAITIAKVAPDPDAVLTEAIFVGNDTTNPDASPVDIFKNPENHATAAASMLEFLARQFNFFPAEQDPSSSSIKSGHYQFLTKINTLPGFVLTLQTERAIKLNDSFNQVAKEIRDSYGSTDARIIARSFRDAIPDIIKDKSLKLWHMPLLVIRKPVDTDTVTLKVVRLELDFTSDTSQTAHIPTQSANLANFEFSIDPTVLSLNAEKFAQEIRIVRVPDFLNFFSSPKVDSESQE